MNYSKFIKSEAIKLGFLAVGFSKARFLEEEKAHFSEWIADGKHGDMKYMENHFDKRLNPNLLVDGAKSVISLLTNYYPEKFQEQKNNPKISKYAYGTDYHFVIKEKLKTLLSIIK